jgi:RNA polymerase sigma factor (sigma-70 family)
MDLVANDIGLLRRYADESDERAFAALVRQYVGVVYSASLRRVGNRELAQDITQAVFIILARRARRLPMDRPLSAWLLTTVKYAAANALRVESRRTKHELAAARMKSGVCSHDPCEALIWQEIAGRIDDAVLKLSHLDRRVVLLRYFEEWPVRDIAVHLKLSETAVKLRLHRAIAKLRHRLDRAGTCAAAVPVEQFAQMLASHAMASAPLGLAGAICSSVRAGAGASAGFSLAKGAIHMMNWTKLKIAAAVAAIAISGACGILSQTHSSARAAEPAARNAPAENPAAQSSPNDMSHVVQFEVGATYLLKDDDIVIEQIHGTSDKIEPGNLYEIKGTYKLASHDKAMLAAFTTSSKGQGIPTQKTQTMMIDKGTGHFTVLQYIWYDGNPHISFYPADGGSSFAAVYFGTGPTLLKHMTWTPTDAPMSEKTTH